MKKVFEKLRYNKIRLIFLNALLLFIMLFTNFPFGVMSVIKAQTIVRVDEEGIPWYACEVIDANVTPAGDYTYNESYEPYDFYTNDETLLDTFQPEFDWKLILVNKDNPLSDDYGCNLIKNDDFEVESRIYFDLNEMIYAAEIDGINLFLSSGYRDYNTQLFLYNRKVNEFKRLGYSDEEAEAAAALKVAPPNTSEHQTGLAVDILSTSHRTMDKEFGNCDAGKWLAENSYKYGFVLRYPEGKENITKIQYEPWHFRYVGKEAAEIMYRHNITLEEFVKSVNERTAKYMVEVTNE